MEKIWDKIAEFAWEEGLAITRRDEKNSFMNAVIQYCVEEPMEIEFLLGCPKNRRGFVTDKEYEYLKKAIENAKAGGYYLKAAAGA